MGFCRHLGLCFSHLLAEDGTASASTAGPAPFPAPPAAAPSSLAHLRPGIAVVVGALTIMLSLTCLLLLYAKHCKRSGGGALGLPASSSAAAAARRNSGVEWTVVLSLPVFRFGSLLGHKDGLECAVCLARFEPAEVLRLLPKCKHAFHVECVDTWLDAHSTCPLCRSRVEPEDVLLVPDPEPPEVATERPGGGEKSRERKGGDGTSNPSGRRVSGRHSSAGEKSTDSVQIVVHRANPDESRYRRSADSAAPPARSADSAAPPARAAEAASVGCFDRGRKDKLLLAEAAEREGVERRFGHRIIVSGGVDGAQERWSDLRPSDLLFLRSEMIITDSGRHSVSRAGRSSCSSLGGGAGGMSVIGSARCASEITGVSRHLHRPGGGARRQEEERTMRRWLGFAANRSSQWALPRPLTGGRR